MEYDVEVELKITHGDGPKTSYLQVGDTIHLMFVEYGRAYFRKDEEGNSNTYSAPTSDILLSCKRTS